MSSNSDRGLASQQTESNGSLDFKIVSKLGHSKFPIFLVEFMKENKTFAMKLFPYDEDQINISYLNESRFKFLAHKNIISVNRVQPKQKSMHKQKCFNASFILMEHAPYGDFSKILRASTLFNDEKLVRTYFHQLIEGIEYLHSQGVAHMDLKPENLLVGEDFQLKITDFDCSFKKRDPEILSKGTKNYRAPEVRNNLCNDPQAADIYSAGITLFILITGYYPYYEDMTVKDYDLQTLLKEEDEKFWEFHENVEPKPATFSESFKKLFFSMVKEDTVERATLEEVKKSAWYTEPIYSSGQLKEIMEKHFRLPSQN